MSFGTDFFQTLIFVLALVAIVSFLVTFGVGARWSETAARNRGRFPWRIVAAGAAVVAACAIGILLSVARITYLDDHEPADPIPGAAYMDRGF